MAITVNIERARDITTDAIKAGLVPIILGSPAIGKSEVVHQIAEEYNLKLIDLRLTQCDPTDLNGFPYIDKELGRAMYVPMDTFPLEDDPIPEGYSGWLIFFDELTHADRGTQKASYKVLLDKMCGQKKIHSKVAMVAAGNLESDNAFVEEMSTALQSRLVHMEMTIDHKAWLAWAEANGIDHRITSFIKYKPDLLYRFNPNHEDRTYASPRTWVFLSRLMKFIAIDAPHAMATFAGTISEGVAREFVGFCKIYNDLLTVEQIKADPTGVLVPKEPSVLFALTGSMAAKATDALMDSLMIFIRRLPVEFQVVCLREIRRRHSDLAEHPALVDWIVDNGRELF